MLNLLLLFQISICQEIQLKRQSLIQQINFEQLQGEITFKCPYELDKQVFNVNNSNVICEQSDLHYIMNAKLGSGSDNFEMFIDLVNPWSWYKSSDCSFYDQSSVDQTIKKQSCFDEHYAKSLKIDEQSANESSINAHDVSMKGHLITTNISISNKDFELEMLQVNNIYAKKQQFFDGAISLSHFLGSNQKDFIMQYTQNNKSIIQFNIFELEQKISFKNDFPIKQNYDLNWINNSNDKSPQWKFKIDQISFKNKKLINEEKQYDAILTLNSQFISLPKELSDKLLKELNSNNNQEFECVYADSNLYVIMCKSLGEYVQKNISINLNISNIEIKLTNLINDCKDKNCFLNIKCSSSNTIFLGEPFFKDNQILLKYETGQIGVYQEKKIQDLKSKDEIQFENLGTWIIVLTILLILIFCLMNIRHAFKWFMRAIKYRKTQIFDDEQKLRSKEVEFGEMEKAEQMTQSIEENSI